MDNTDIKLKSNTVKSRLILDIEWEDPQGDLNAAVVQLQARVLYLLNKDAGIVSDS